MFSSKEKKFFLEKVFENFENQNHCLKIREEVEVSRSFLRTFRF